jgi:hypothetical protein
VISGFGVHLLLLQPAHASLLMETIISDS